MGDGGVCNIAGPVDSDGVGARGILLLSKVYNNFLFLSIFVIKEHATISTTS
jgi:hypothetical protein